MTDARSGGQADTIIRKVFGIPDPPRERSERERLIWPPVSDVPSVSLTARPPGINQLISSDIDRVKTMSTPRLKRDGSQTHSLNRARRRYPNGYTNGSPAQT